MHAGKRACKIMVDGDTKSLRTFLGELVFHSQFECLCRHRRMYRAPLLLERGSWIRIFYLISALSLRLSTPFHPLSFESTELHQWEKKKNRKKKIKHQIFKLTWRREAFCAHAPTLSRQTEGKICFLTCGNTLSTRNRPVHLVKQSICISPTQQVTSSTKGFNKNKSEVAACGCVTKCQYRHCE